jgi:predicted nucleic acid-binding protein
VIIDASALVPFVVSQAQSPYVAAALATAPTLIAPDILVAEVANTLRTLWRKREVTTDEAYDAMVVSRRRVSLLVPTDPLASRALRLAITHNHPAYDCFYVALAERERQTLLTCDRALAATFAEVAEIRLLGPPDARGR